MEDEVAGSRPVSHPKMIKIRKADSSDLDTLISLGKDLHLVEKQFEPLLKFSKSEAIERYKKELQNSKSIFLIAEENQEFLGYLYGYLEMVDYLEASSPEAQLELIYLKPEARGKGIATKMVSEFVSWSKKQGAFRVKAGIYEKNAASKKLFLRSDFKPYHTTYSLDLG